MTWKTEKLVWQGTYYRYQRWRDEIDNEHKFRREIAQREYDDYMGEVVKYHSVGVMMNEAKKFLQRLPQNAVVLDVGGCWGWHWREASLRRPDVSIVIVDICAENFIHARRLLGADLGQNVYLVEANAVDLPFPNEAFDAVWTVQTLQHIQKIERATSEAFRVLKRGGKLRDYSLCYWESLGWMYRVFGRVYEKYSVSDERCLRRSGEEEIRRFERYSGSTAEVSYSEILFKPELGITQTGRENSILSWLDIMLSKRNTLLRYLARQVCIEVTKA